MSAVTKLGKASTAVRKPKIKRAGISLRLKRDPTQARGIVIATQSTAAGFLYLRACALTALELIYGCFGGRDPSGIYLWWILWFRVYKRAKLNLLCLRRRTTRFSIFFLHLCRYHPFCHYFRTVRVEMDFFISQSASKLFIDFCFGFCLKSRTRGGVVFARVCSYCAGV